MTDANDNRYLVRRGTRLWMIGDREKRAPAMLRNRQLVIMEEESARALCSALNSMALPDRGHPD
jgi:hypothetical protein